MIRLLRESLAPIAFSDKQHGHGLRYAVRTTLLRILVLLLVAAASIVIGGVGWFIYAIPDKPPADSPVGPVLPIHIQLFVGFVPMLLMLLLWIHLRTKQRRRRLEEYRRHYDRMIPSELERLERQLLLVHETKRSATAHREYLSDEIVRTTTLEKTIAVIGLCHSISLETSRSSTMARDDPTTALLTSKLLLQVCELELVLSIHPSGEERELAAVTLVQIRSELERQMSENYLIGADAADPSRFRNTLVERAAALYGRIRDLLESGQYENAWEEHRF